MMTDLETEDDSMVEYLDDLDLDSSLAEALAEANALLDSDEQDDDLEKTIQTMAATKLCVHPSHSHSFSKITFTLGASLRKCAGCSQGFKAVSVFGGSSGSSVASSPDLTQDGSIVKCMACGALAHRSCALSSTVTWSEACPVNGHLVEKAAKAMMVVTDDEDEDADEEIEMDLNENLRKLCENGGNEKDSHRKNSFVSNASSDESMRTQELDDGEAEQFVAGVGDVNLENPDPEGGATGSTAPHGQSPNGGPRRSLSSLLFSKRREAGDNPYDDVEDETKGIGEPENSTVEETAESGYSPGSKDVESADNEGENNSNAGRKRMWFGNNSPKKGGKSEADGDESEDADAAKNPNRVRSRGWFSASRRKTGTEGKQSSQDDRSAINDQPELTDNVEVLPVVPASSTLYPSVVQVDREQAAARARVNQSENKDDDPADNANVVSRRGWFNRKGRSAEDAPERSEVSSIQSVVEDPSEAPKRGFGLFSKKTSQKDVTIGDDGQTWESQNAPAQTLDGNTEDKREAEFSEFLEVDDDELEFRKKRATAEFEQFFLDVDDEDEEPNTAADTTAATADEAAEQDVATLDRVNQAAMARINKQSDPVTVTVNEETEKVNVISTEKNGGEDTRAHPSLGLLRNRKVSTDISSTEAGTMEAEKAGGDKSCLDQLDEANQGVGCNESNEHIPEQVAEREVDDEAASHEVLQSELPKNGSKTSLVSLFSRRSGDANDKTNAPEQSDEKIIREGTQATIRKRSSLMDSIWGKTSASMAEDQGDVHTDDVAKKAKTKEMSQRDVKQNSPEQKPSLLSRVFSGGKSDNDGEKQTSDVAAVSNATDETVEGFEETTPRRFRLFSSKRVDDVCESVTKEDAENETTGTRKFSLFGFRRNGKEVGSKETDEALQHTQSWASDEPPSHWTTTTTAASPNFSFADDGCNQQGDDEVSNEAAIHYANHPFASVSRALQDNIMALLSDGEQGAEADGDEQAVEESVKENVARKAQSSVSLIVSPDSPESAEADVSVLGEIKPEPVQESTLAKVATGTYEAVKATAAVQKKMGMASVAGGIAGGVAGLMFSGPAGALVGIRYGQTAGALGVVLEGSITVGVIVAGVAGGRFTAEKIQEQMEEQRVLTIGEQGIARKVMLVRPTIRIDPAWHDICAEAQRTSPSSRSVSFGFFSATDALKQDRYERTSDICEEEEIPTEEKVLLLVSRVLSDKDSFPGHVYRKLMQAYKDRCHQRKDLRGELARNKEDFPHLFDGGSDEMVNMGGGLKISMSPRARREDAHGVIKYITGTLLEVRPGLSSTPEITETTASVVEALVFGEVYDLVYEEIAIEATDKDKKLIEKIDDFEYARLERTGLHLCSQCTVSRDAISALKRLPETHAAVDKLRFCVAFLEKISDHFATVSNSTMGADSLLKMVCQHLIVAKMPGLNAEIAFLEEFARDEQLLRGKEGYALVTLQAALHFLNMSNDFERDIFVQDNIEENVPLSAVSRESADPEVEAVALAGAKDEGRSLLKAQEAALQAGAGTSGQLVAIDDALGDDNELSAGEAREEKKEEALIADDDDLL